MKRKGKERKDLRRLRYNERRIDKGGIGGEMCRRERAQGGKLKSIANKRRVFELVRVGKPHQAGRHFGRDSQP